MQEEQIEQIEESKEPTVKDMIKKSTRNYLGLSNLGNTCYMNSLL
jgi:ubiquitin C-terminal hydrolase